MEKAEKRHRHLRGLLEPGPGKRLGDIDIRPVDMLNIFWEPGIRDLQDSRDLFTVELRDNALLEEEYPQLHALSQSLWKWASTSMTTAWIPAKNPP